MRSLHVSFAEANNAPRKTRLHFMLAAALLSFGCASRTRPAVVPEPSEGEVEERPDGLSEERAREGERLLGQIRADLETRRARVRSLRGRAEIVLTAPRWGGSTRLESAVLARRPGSLRLRGWVGPITVFDVASDAEQVVLYLPDKDRVWRGSPSSLEERTGFPFVPADLVAALLGEPFGDPDSLRLEDVGRDLITVSWGVDEKTTVEGRYRRDRLLPTEFVLREEGDELAVLRYSDFLREEVGWWPRVVGLTWPKERAKLQLTFRDLELNPNLPSDAFEPNVPDGVEEVELGDATEEEARVGAGR